MPCGCRRCPVCVRACEKPRVFLWGCVGLGRECFGYAKAPWGVCSEGLPVRVVRRRATLPHPVGCSTIAVPGLSFRVRNGTGRLSWAMAAANLGLSAGKQGVSRRRVAVRGPDNGRDSLLLTDRARVRTVLPVRLRGALPGPAPHTLAGVWMWVASRPLVPVGSTPRGASTSGLSTTCSAWGLQELEGSTECLSWSRLPA